MGDQPGWGGQTPPEGRGYSQQQFQRQQYEQYQAPSGHPLARSEHGPLQEAPTGLLSMVLGIVGLSGFPLIPSMAAVVLGHRAKRDVQEQPYRYKDSFSQVGIVTGWVGIAFVDAVLVVLAVTFYVTRSS